jgi:Type IV secretion-system coupling protein DNA-binding domain
MSADTKQVHTGWETNQPVWSIGAVLVAVLVFAVMCWLQYAVLWNSLQRYYAPIYAKTGFRAWHYANSSADYDLIMLLDHHGRPQLAMPDQIMIEPQPGGRLNYQYQLSDDAQARGLRVASESWHYSDAVLHAHLAELIYDDHALIEYLEVPAFVALVVLVVLLFFAGPLDRKRSIALLRGQRLSGTEQVSVVGFNLRMRHRKKVGGSLLHGVAFLDAGRSWLSRQLNLPTSRGLYLPREREQQHVLLMGDSGKGKSSAIRQLLHQIAERGELAVIYDPGGEYAKEFYDPKQDIIANPLDERCPYYSLADEVEDDAEAMTVAKSLFPDRPHEPPFFADSARRLFAYLLCLQPKPEELVHWLSHPTEIDKRVRGTELETTLASDAPGQRKGVLASLNMVADALKLLPKEDEAKSRFSTKAWAKQRRGWIFITSMPKTREAQRPLISLWIDLLVLRIMESGAASGQKTWFIVDEMHSLQRLPQLATALAESRKAHCALVIGFQGRAQMVDLYGPLAETMLSQASTKLFFATSDPDAAYWISRAIGEVEYLRHRISQSQGQKGGDSESQQREIVPEPLVRYSVIMGLEPLECYLKHGQYAVHFHTAYIDAKENHPAFLQRKRVSVREKMQPALRALPASSEPQPAESLPLASSTQQQHEFFE